MNINVTDIIAEKLAQLEADGTIKRKIEEALEKSLMSAITDELGSYSFRSGIQKQVRESISHVAEDCGFSAYNGYIAERVKAMVQEMYTTDIAAKIQSALNDIIIQKHESVKLSDIFARYRAWVLEHTDDSDKYSRERFTSELCIKESGAFTHYDCYFSEEHIEIGSYLSTTEDADIQISFCTYNREESTSIGRLFLNGHDISNTLRIGHMTDFEAFLVNLFYNKTKIIMDVDDVDDNDHFDIDI